MLAPNPTAKACTKCGDVKPLDEFHKGTGRYGRNAWCRLCMGASVKARQAQLRAADPEGYLAHKREIVERHRLITGNQTGKEYGRAQSRAFRRLAALFETEYRQILNEELDRERAQ